MLEVFASKQKDIGSPSEELRDVLRRLDAKNQPSDNNSRLGHESTAPEGTSDVDIVDKRKEIGESIKEILLLYLEKVENQVFSSCTLQQAKKISKAERAILGVGNSTQTLLALRV